MRSCWSECANFRATLPFYARYGSARRAWLQVQRNRPIRFTHLDSAASFALRPHGSVKPAGHIARLVHRRWWHFATQSEADAAQARLKQSRLGKATAPGERRFSTGRDDAEFVSVHEIPDADPRPGWGSGRARAWTPRHSVFS